MSFIDPENRMPLSEAEDSLLPFQLEVSQVRGRIIRLGPSIDQILDQHDYPSSVCRMLAQVSALAAALGTALKIEGIFTIQTNTDGPVRMLVVDVTSDGAVRACAQFDPDRVSATQSEGELLGKGHLVFTVDQKYSDERYQGVVELQGQSLVEAFQHYFRQSEQIKTGLFVAAHQDEAGRWYAGCLMVQKMPREGGVETSLSDTSEEDDWIRIMMLMQTCSTEEITNPRLPLEDLLYRLFHEEGVRVYEPLSFRHECRCSLDRIKVMLAGMAKDDLKDMVQEDGKITVTCQFCNGSYVFDKNGEEIVS